MAIDEDPTGKGVTKGTSGPDEPVAPEPEVSPLFLDVFRAATQGSTPPATEEVEALPEGDLAEEPGAGAPITGTTQPVPAIQIEREEPIVPKLYIDTQITIAIHRGNFDHALAIADSVEDETMHDGIIRRIVTALNRDRRFEQAIEVAGKLMAQSERDWAYREIARLQVRTGQIDRAIETAGQIISYRERHWIDQIIARAQANAGSPPVTAREITAVYAGVVRPAAIPPPVPADAEPTIRSTAQFSRVQPGTVIPLPTPKETLIAREVAGRMAGLFPAFPEGGPGESQGAPLDDADAFDSSPTMIGGPGAAQTLEVAGEIDPFDHEKTGIRPAPRAPAALDERTAEEILHLPPPRLATVTADEKTTGERHVIPGLTPVEKGFFDSQAPAEVVAECQNDRSWLSDAMDYIRNFARSSARSISENCKAVFKACVGFSERLGRGARRQVDLWLAQIDAARRARQIRLPEQARDQTAVISRPARSLLRSPAALIFGATLVGGGISFYALSDRIAGMRRDQGGFTERADNGEPPAVVHAQTPRIPTLGPGAAPPKRPMPQAAAKPPQPKPVTVSPQQEFVVKPPRTIVLNCDIQGGIPGCCLPKGTECKPVPPDMLDKDRFDRAKSRITGIIRGRLSVLHNGVEYVSRDPIAFRSGEELIRLDRIEFVERSK